MRKVPLKRYLVSRNGGAWGDPPNENEVDVLCIRVADFDYKNLESAKDSCTIRSYSKDQIDKLLLKNGDILLEKSGGGEKTPVSRAVMFTLNKPAVCSNFIERLTFNTEKITGEFACKLLSAAYESRINICSIKQTTGIQNLDIDSFLMDVKVPDLNLQEQIRISKIINSKLMIISRLQKKLSTSVNILSEYRYSLITHTVTKGLNPGVQMKDSGIPWIGRVPASWRISKIKYFSSVKNGISYSSSEECEKDQPGALAVIRSTNIKEGKFFFGGDDVYINKCVPDDLILRKDDLVIVRTNGSAKLVGKSCIIPKLRQKATAGAFMLICRSDINHFLYWVLNSDCLQYYRSSFRTTTINQISNQQIGDIEIPIPPRSEMMQIQEYLSERVSKIDSIISSINQQITAIENYRQSVVSSAINGI